MSDLFLVTYPLALEVTARLEFYRQAQESWDKRLTMSDDTLIPFKIIVNDVRSFLATAPRAWVDGPTPTNPSGGFPGNLWIGTEVLGQRDLHRVAALRAMRPSPRILFVRMLHDQHDGGITIRKTIVRTGMRRHLNTRRCPSCGTRYESERSLFRPFYFETKTKCDHTTACGSISLVPQIHLVVSTVENLELESMLLEEQIPLWPQPPLTW